MNGYMNKIEKMSPLELQSIYYFIICSRLKKQTNKRKIRLIVNFTEIKFNHAFWQDGKPISKGHVFFFNETAHSVQR